MGNLYIILTRWKINSPDLFTYFLKIYFISCVWLFYLRVCLCTMWVPNAHTGQNRVLVYWHWSCRWLLSSVGAGNPTSVLCKSGWAILPALTVFKKTKQSTESALGRPAPCMLWISGQPRLCRKVLSLPNRTKQIIKTNNNKNLEFRPVQDGIEPTRWLRLALNSLSAGIPWKLGLTL